MARTRSIKPSFFSNEELADVEPIGRLLFIGLWTQADREGRLEDRPRRIRANVLPYDDCNVDALLTDLSEHGFIVRYEVDGARLIQIANFVKHQQPHYKEALSVLPAPPGWIDSGYVVAGVPEAQRQAVLDRGGRRCARCGATDNLSVDHATSRKNGGSNEDVNLRTLCRSCNSSKGKRDVGSRLGQGQSDDGSLLGSRRSSKAPDDTPEPGTRNPVLDNRNPVNTPQTPQDDDAALDAILTVDDPLAADAASQDTRSSLAIVIDAVRAAGLTITTTARDGKALKDSAADPLEVAEVFVAVARGEYGDDFDRSRLSVHRAVELLNGYRVRDTHPKANGKHRGKYLQPTGKYGPREWGTT